MIFVAANLGDIRNFPRGSSDDLGNRVDNSGANGRGFFAEIYTLRVYSVFSPLLSMTSISSSSSLVFDSD